MWDGVLREHAHARHGGRDGQLDLADAELLHQPVEQGARGVTRSGRDAVAR
jgi:hypothetical protein